MAHWIDVFSPDETGSDGGVIRRDEQTTGARITLEEGGILAPFSITCGVYGWMMHTRCCPNREAADRDFEAMKAELDTIVEQIPRRDAVENGQSEAATAAIHAFVERFP
ncbi:MAG: hypothetical protein AAF799_07290 [Myxococcota bacterium]